MNRMLSDLPFMTVPNDGRDLAPLETRLTRYAGRHCVTVTPCVGTNGTSMVIISLPPDTRRRSEIRRIAQEWQSAGRDPQPA